MDRKAEEQSSASSGHPVLTVLLAQLGSGLVLGALFWGVSGTVAGYSAVIGGLTCVVPNAFLALRLVVPRRDPGPGALVRAAYVGELGKLALTVLIFSIVFTLVRPLAAGPLFAGFIVAQMATFSGFLIKEKNKETAESKQHGR